MMIASGHERQHAPAPAQHEERHRDVEDDVEELEGLRSFEHVPSAPGDDRQQPGRGQQQHDHDQPRDLRRGLLAVGVLDADVAVVVVGHALATLQSPGWTRAGWRERAWRNW
jgi:hypothetical protein